MLSLGLQFYLIYSVLKVVIKYVQNKFEVEKVKSVPKKIHIFLWFAWFYSIVIRYLNFYSLNLLVFC